MIYDDDISFKQYETIVNFIFEEINKHKSILNKNTKEFLKFIKKIKVILYQQFYKLIKVTNKIFLIKLIIILQMLLIQKIH